MAEWMRAAPSASSATAVPTATATAPPPAEQRWVWHDSLLASPHLPEPRRDDRLSLPSDPPVPPLPTAEPPFPLLADPPLPPPPLPPPFAPHQEITTVFIVGFPDDITEREFHNLFLFAPGFEAATLKPPPPPTAAPLLTSSQPAKLKQTIGFARFRTRADALAARDGLHGRKIDPERGAVLKTEMAKKNLHTKPTRPPPAGPPHLHPLLPHPPPLGLRAFPPTASRYDDDERFLSSPPLPLSPTGMGLATSSGGNMPSGFSAFPPGAPSLMGAPLDRVSRFGPSPTAEWDEPTEDFAFDPGVGGVIRSGPPPPPPPPPAWGDEWAPRPPPLGQEWGRDAFAAPDWPALGGNPLPPPTAGRWSISGPAGRSPPSSAGFRPLSPPAAPAGPILRGASSPDPSFPPALANASFSRLGVDPSTPVPGPSAQATPRSRSTGPTGLGDHNPPGTTLFVGNLPSSLAAGGEGYAKEFEEALRALFALQPGYRAMAFRVLSSKSPEGEKDDGPSESGSPTPTPTTGGGGGGGPVCFVEYDSIAAASSALQALNGHLLDGRVKPPGLRLSFSKNPLFRRHPHPPPGSAAASSAHLAHPHPHHSRPWASSTGEAIGGLSSPAGPEK